MTIHTFSGRSIKDANEYLAYVERYAIYKHLTKRELRDLLPILLRDTAIDFYDGLSHDQRDT